MLPDIAKFALMSQKEKHFLFDFLSDKGKITVLEIGTFLGASAAIMAAANKNAKIYSIDDYNHKHDDHKPEVVDMISSLFGDQNRSIDLVRNLTKEYGNIIFYRGKSPRDFLTWNEDIDIYLEDGTHKNPLLSDSVRFWSRFIKPNGYLILHDYRPFLKPDHPSRFQDVIDLENQLSSDFKRINCVDSLLILQKI